MIGPKSEVAGNATPNWSVRQFVLLFGWLGDDYWALPQAAQYKISTRFNKPLNAGLTSMFLRSYKTWSYLRAYSQIDLALYLL